MAANKGPTFNKKHALMEWKKLYPNKAMRIQALYEEFDFLMGDRLIKTVGGTRWVGPSDYKFTLGNLKLMLRELGEEV